MNTWRPCITICHHTTLCDELKTLKHSACHHSPCNSITSPFLSTSSSQDIRLQNISSYGISHFNCPRSSTQTLSLPLCAQAAPKTSDCKISVFTEFHILTALAVALGHKASLSMHMQLPSHQTAKYQFLWNFTYNCPRNSTQALSLPLCAQVAPKPSDCKISIQFCCCCKLTSKPP